MCFCLFVLLLYALSQQLWSWRDGQFTYHTFSWASLNKQLTSTSCTLACNWQQPFLNDSAEGRRMTVEIISWSFSTKVWERAGIKLSTPGSAVRLASVARQVIDCAMRPGGLLCVISINLHEDILRCNWIMAHTRMFTDIQTDKWKEMCPHFLDFLIQPNDQST